MVPHSWFTSPRERRLWLWALAAVAAIYSSLGTAGKLAQVLRRGALLEVAFALGFVLVLAAIAASARCGRRAPRGRPGRLEIWVALGIVSVYGTAVVRMGVGPEERTHLFEYGFVALLVHQALVERFADDRGVWRPAVLAVVLTALLGWLDEGIQALMPSRVYDLRDVGTNAAGALLAVAASLSLAWAGRWGRDRLSPRKGADAPQRTDDLRP